MKKLILGLWLSCGALYSADEFMCNYNAERWLESNEKSQKAFKLDLIDESQRYANDVIYYTKQMLINCDEKGKIYKVAKKVLDSHKKIEAK